MRQQISIRSSSRADTWSAPPFAEVFPGAALLVTGVEDPASNAHSENESLHLGEFENACVAEALFLGMFAERA